MKQLFNGAYRDKTVLVTGHTGFKGSWLTTWLTLLGARVIGFSLPDPPTDPSMYEVIGLGSQIDDRRGDIGNLASISSLIEDTKPDIIFHMAAQPIVLRSFNEPHLTFATNAMGTVNLLEGVRLTKSVRAVVSITTDKVYHDNGWLWGYRETDRLGGKDPYSASKAMAELAILAYQQSFFRPDQYDHHGVGLASVRAGNVIGGGDLAPYRLVPDCMRALMQGEPIPIRNPHYVRPWQHVLVPLSGYLLVGQRLLSGKAPDFSSAWNFGPAEQVGITVRQIAEKLIEQWGAGSFTLTEPDLEKKETFQLRLSWEKAAQQLGWHPAYSWEEALAEIVAWFKAYAAGVDMLAITQKHIADFVDRAAEQQAPWVEK